MNGRVLVASERAKSAGAMAAALEAHDWRSITAAGFQATQNALLSHRIDAILIEATSEEMETLRPRLPVLREASKPRRVPIVCRVIGEAPPSDEALDAFDAVVLDAFRAEHVARRLEELSRLAVMEEQAYLRAHSLARRGDPVRLDTLPPRRTGSTILYVGAPNPSFLALQRALGETGGRLSAAQTTFCAFDFLHDLDFDAVILNALDDEDRALTLCTALRRNTKLFHTPVLLLLDPNDEALIDEALSEGASGVIFPDSGLDDIAAHVNDLARQRQRRTAITTALNQARTLKTVNAPTGVATAHFFLEHLQAMGENAVTTRRPLAAIVLRAEAPRAVPRAKRDAALDQLGGMLRHLVRTEDFCGRLSSAVYAVALPNADLAEANAIAERLSAVGECTAFENDDADRPFQLTVVTEAVELHPGETGRSLMARALKAFDIAKTG